MATAVRRKKDTRPRIAIKGFLRAQIVNRASGKVVGDSGWRENQITNYGMESCLLGAMAGAAGTVQVVGVMLGNGTEPASNATELPDKNTDYYTTVAEAINNSTQAQFTASMDGGSGGGAATFANMGLLAASDGSLICGNTFPSSAMATTQDISVTYNLNFATS